MHPWLTVVRFVDADEPHTKTATWLSSQVCNPLGDPSKLLKIDDAVFMANSTI